MRKEEIRDNIYEAFKGVLESRDVAGRQIEGIQSADAYGHSAGTPLESWVKSHLNKIPWTVQSWFPDGFLNELFSQLGSKGAIMNALGAAWWGSILTTKKQVDDFLSGRRVQRWQQEAGDIVLFYGSDIVMDFQRVVLLNVKSHNLDRSSRPPNIMSAMRLLKFFADLQSRKDSHTLLNFVSYLFVGVDYRMEPNGLGFVDSVHVKELMKLDLHKLPMINFDAAIQIQWHVRDMIEKEQTPEEFIRDLKIIFRRKWDRHVQGKEKKFKELLD